MQYIYDRIIFGDVKLINDVVLGILNDIKPIVDEDTRFDMRLILSELLINSHEHGNKLDKNKYINLSLRISKRSIWIEVSDEGKGIEKIKPYNLYDFKTNGRGLLIVKSLVDKLVIDKNNIKCNIELTP